MKEKGFATVEELEAEVNRLRGIVLDPQEIEPMILKNHTEVNIVRVADYIQTEGTITFSHSKFDRLWIPTVSIGMSVREPIELTSKLVGTAMGYERLNSGIWTWNVKGDRALSLLKTVKPYLMADKLESARYVLNIGRAIPDTEYRPMYHGIVKRARRPVFLYPEYVDFPLKYAVLVHRGKLLPRPLRRVFAIKYNPDSIPRKWRKWAIKS